MEFYDVLNYRIDGSSRTKFCIKMKNLTTALIILILFSMQWTLNGQSGVLAPSPLGPTPNENQLRWHEMEFYAFVHFSLNTYTDQSWGYGNEDLSLFNPDKLDCRQWARVCKEAGMKGIIVTAKHHCGFCLWPSKYTEYSVKNSPWKNGKGDVIRELADACKEYGLKLGIYLSPWDRNSKYYGKPEYITYFRNQLTELLTNYGEIFEIWFDGANGGDGYYGGANETRKIDRTTYYDWKNTYALIRKLQPKIVIWNDGGDRGDLRWVGTEDGYVGETNWSLLNSTGEVGFEMLHHGVENGDAWVPAEVNTSIRPEWFYHKSEDTKVKSVYALQEIYYNSIGRNGSLLLNFPIMPNGLINDRDEKVVLDFAKQIKESFRTNLASGALVSSSNVRGGSDLYSAEKSVDGESETYLATDDSVSKASLIIDFKRPVVFNRFMIQEYIRYGQRVKAFSVEAHIDGSWVEIARGTTIGYKRILRHAAVTSDKLRVNVIDSKRTPLISEIGVFYAPMVLDVPLISRNQIGEVTISSQDEGASIYYTTDGGEPTTKSNLYTKPFLDERKVEIRAIAYDSLSGKKSSVGVTKFDISKKGWTILGVTDEKVKNIIDGDPETSFCFSNERNQPVEITIDLGATYSVGGFQYLPDQGRWPCQHIVKYQLSVSLDNIKWEKVSEGEFANIRNNPLVQEINFDAIKVRYVRLMTIANTEGVSNQAGCSEIDVLTK